MNVPRTAEVAPISIFTAELITEDHTNLAYDVIERVLREDKKTLGERRGPGDTHRGFRLGEYDFRVQRDESGKLLRVLVSWCGEPNGRAPLIALVYTRADFPDDVFKLGVMRPKHLDRALAELIKIDLLGELASL